MEGETKAFPPNLGTDKGVHTLSSYSVQCSVVSGATRLENETQAMETRR